MEINKQLFEDVLSGKLKGTFVLRSGKRCTSCDLTRGEFNIFPYCLCGCSYRPDGTYNAYSRAKSRIDIVDFIPDTNMKENELTIEIPEGKIVDWEASQKQNKIIFKGDEKSLTYKDICEKLFDGKKVYYIHSDGTINSLPFGEMNTAHIADVNNTSTEHQLECILAKNKLANVAVYLNDGWKPDKCSDIYYISNDHGNLVIYLNKETCTVYIGQVIFKTKELAQQAIEILGEETVKLALEPLGI